MHPADFCDAFFHVKPTPEAGVAEACCLRGPHGCCSGKTTALIAQLVDDASGAVLHVGLYKNESQRAHAEELLMRDERLLTAASAVIANEEPRQKTLIVYLTIQPCHFSSGDDSRSCSASLLRWHDEQLIPRGVGRLRIKAAYPYRAHWDASRMSDDDLAVLGRRKWGGGSGGSGGGRREQIGRARTLLQSARDGTQLLVNSGHVGVTLEAFSATDWEGLALLCLDGPSHAAWAGRTPPFTSAAFDSRTRMDAFTKRVFDSFRGLPAASSAEGTQTQFSTSAAAGAAVGASRGGDGRGERGDARRDGDGRYRTHGRGGGAWGVADERGGGRGGSRRW